MLNPIACPTDQASIIASLPLAELDAIKARQRATWASGDFGIIGTTLQIVGESLCEAVDLRAGSTVLDVAAGNGNCSLAAARRWCDVTSTDYVPALLEDGRRRAEADRLPITFQEADAEALPVRDASFDVVLSSFGVMFAPNHARAATELLRVCRPGGADRPGQLDAARVHRTAVRGRRPPRAAAAGAHAAGALGHGGAPRAALRRRRRRTSTPRTATSCSATTRRQHWIDVFRTWYGPVHKAFAGLPPEAQPRSNATSRR